MDLIYRPESGTLAVGMAPGNFPCRECGVNVYPANASEDARRGARGPQGEAGAQGERGPRRPKSEPGPMGRAGKDATVVATGAPSSSGGYRLLSGGQLVYRRRHLGVRRCRRAPRAASVGAGHLANPPRLSAADPPLAFSPRASTRQGD